MRRESAFIRLDELDTERSALLQQARSELQQTIEEAIDQLDRLGFSYSLVENTGANGTRQARPLRAKSKGKVNGKKVASRALVTRRTRRKGTRRAGIRQDVLSAIGASGKKGMTRGDLIAHFRANDNSFKQSISNALVALKKQKQLKATNGVYKAAA